MRARTISVFLWESAKMSQPWSNMLFLPSVAPYPTEIDCGAETASLVSHWHVWRAEEGFLQSRSQKTEPETSSELWSQVWLPFLVLIQLLKSAGCIQESHQVRTYFLQLLRHVQASQDKWHRLIYYMSDCTGLHVKQQHNPLLYPAYTVDLISLRFSGNWVRETLVSSF